MPSTPRGYPYPDPTAPVAAGADDIHALATATDDLDGRKVTNTSPNGITVAWAHPSITGTVDGAVSMTLGSVIGAPVYSMLSNAGTEGNGYLVTGIPAGYRVVACTLARDNGEGIACVVHPNGTTVRAFATSNNVPAANYAGPWLVLFSPTTGTARDDEPGFLPAADSAPFVPWEDTP